jgi:undecaprenyl diphosphate synthase
MRIYEKYSQKELEGFGLKGKMPAHIGIIMDGNGRWATKRLMPRPVGHRAGMEALKEIVRESHCLGLKALTVYAFSTENWQRPAAEVSGIFGLLTEYFIREIDELHANGVKLRVLGDMGRLPDKARASLEAGIERTKDNTGLEFCIAVNYGARAEILRAAKKLIESGVGPDEVTEELFAGELYTAGIPDPDVIIRTAGEQRLSNFLLWQAAYSEFVFTSVLWPDFTPAELRNCIIEYMKRTRRFGKVVE